MSDFDVSVDGDISQSVIVTGNGNNVSLRFGGSGIEISVDRKQVPRPARRQQSADHRKARELDVLDPQRGHLPLIGREDRVAIIAHSADF